ncbi:unnamed protein product [Taenia asiatica]|uniref:DUF2281 domain-containing protein n=1 Tax=Taenia asiatica TaxID=60517 RepID=A0A0R3WF32_TAEAS|nr:unnamed protein product [Taenia asiatica]
MSSRDIFTTFEQEYLTAIKQWAEDYHDNPEFWSTSFYDKALSFLEDQRSQFCRVEQHRRCPPSCQNEHQMTKEGWTSTAPGACASGDVLIQKFIPLEFIDANYVKRI